MDRFSILVEFLLDCSLDARQVNGLYFGSVDFRVIEKKYEKLYKVEIRKIAKGHGRKVYVPFVIFDDRICFAFEQDSLTIYSNGITE